MSTVVQLGYTLVQRTITFIFSKQKFVVDKLVSKQFILITKW